MYIKYLSEDGVEILIEAAQTSAGAIKASNQEAIVPSKTSLTASFDSLKALAKSMRQQLNDFKADETQVKFALKTTGELGLFAVGKLGVETNFEVTLKWKDKSP